MSYYLAYPFLERYISKQRSHLLLPDLNIHIDEATFGFARDSRQQTSTRSYSGSDFPKRMQSWSLLSASL